MVTSSPRFRAEERNRASRTTQRPKITKRINASGTISWCVDLGLVNGKRRRHFYKTKQEAETKGDQFKIARTNLGTAAFSLTDKQRIDATEALGLLAPVNVSLVQHAVTISNTPSQRVRLRSRRPSPIFLKRSNGLDADPCT